MSSGASLLRVHERQPAQQYIKIVKFKEEKFLFNKYFIKYFLSDKLLKQKWIKQNLLRRISTLATYLVS